MRLSVPLLLASVVLVTSHPGHDETASLELVHARSEHQSLARRGLEACQDKPSYRSLQARAVQRRAETVNLHRKRGVNPTGVGHNFTESRPDINPFSDERRVFGATPISVLNPEGEIGPFYVQGEFIRQDLREDQPGVSIILESQLVDVETCEPLTNAWFDLWSCSSTGNYSGVVDPDFNNTENINATHLRGIQETDHDGVVKFITIFPGHYAYRSTHAHVIVHVDATMLPNNTLASGHVAHIGQLFWDQDLVYAVEETYPYNTNTIAITENADDHVIYQQELVNDSDPAPFFNYVYLGDSVEDGLFGWITIGINTSASYTPAYSYELTSGGGKEVNATGNFDVVYDKK